MCKWSPPTTLLHFRVTRAGCCFPDIVCDKWLIRPNQKVKAGVWIKSALQPPRYECHTGVFKNKIAPGAFESVLVWNRTTATGGNPEIQDSGTNFKTFTRSWTRTNRCQVLTDWTGKGGVFFILFTNTSLWMWACFTKAPSAATGKS